MAIQISYQKKDGYLAAQIRGEWETLSLREAFQAIKGMAATEQLNRILVDAFAVSRPRTEMHRFTLGEDLAHIFHQQFKIAILYKPEFTNKFAEDTAANRGARVRVFGDEAKALEWLLQHNA